MIRAKNGNIIFENQAELAVETKRRVKFLIDKEIEQVKEQATKDACTLMLPVIATCLYEAFGFGLKRFEKFAEYFDKHLSCISDGITTADQYEAWCKEQGYKCLIVEAEE